MNWAPDRGDIIWLRFSHNAGHEQAGKRPALVLSPKSYNAKVGLALVCPITSKPKGFPFEVSLPEGKISGVILADQIKNMDWRAREAKPAGRVPKEVTDEALNKLRTLIG